MSKKGQNPIGAFAAAPISGFLISAAREKTQISYWRLCEREPFLRASTAERVSAIAVTFDGNFSFTGTQSGQLLVHNIFGGQLLGVMPGTRGREVAALSLSADQRRLALAIGDSARVLSLPVLLNALIAGRDTAAWQEAELWRWTRGAARVSALCFPAMLEGALAVASDCTVTLISATGESLQTFVLTEAPLCLCASASGALFTVGFASGAVALMSLKADEQCVQYTQLCTTAITAVCYDDDRNTILATSSRALFALNDKGNVSVREPLSEGGSVALLLPFNECFLQSLASPPPHADDPPPPAKVSCAPPRGSLLAMRGKDKARDATPPKSTDATTFLALFERELLRQRPVAMPSPVETPSASVEEELRRARAVNQRLIARIIEMEEESATTNG